MIKPRDLLNTTTLGDAARAAANDQFLKAAIAAERKAQERAKYVTK